MNRSLHRIHIDEVKVRHHTLLYTTHGLVRPEPHPQISTGQ